MKDKVESLRRNGVYTLKDITQVIPWAKNWRTARKLLEADMAGPNLLHCEITGTASQRRYTVRGKHLIKYINIYGPALMGTVRKPKQIYVRTKRSKTKSAGTGGKKGGKTR